LKIFVMILVPRRAGLDLLLFSRAGPRRSSLMASVVWLSEHSSETFTNLTCGQMLFEMSTFTYMPFCRDLSPQATAVHRLASSISNATHRRQWKI
jgi:hypothetical protein